MWFLTDDLAQFAMDEDHETLRAAFAFIDECAVGVSGDTPVQLADDDALELAHLQVEAIALQLQLEELLHAVREKGPSSILTDAWRHTAAGQQADRQRVEFVNQQLLDAIDRHTRVAKRSRQAAMRYVQQIMTAHTSLLSSNISYRSFQPTAAVAPFLRHRLQSMYCNMKTNHPTQPSPMELFPQHKVQSIEQTASGGVHLSMSSTRFYPFKLSTVVAEVWRLITEDLMVARHALTTTADGYHEVHGGMWARHSLRVGYVELAGDCMLRRIDEADGSVVILIVSKDVPCGSDTDDNLSYGFASSEENWIRFRRVEGSGLRAMVMVESMASVDIHPMQSETGVSPSTTRRQQRLCEFLKLSTEQVGARNRQLIENRLLDASRRQ